MIKIANKKNLFHIAFLFLFKNCFVFAQTVTFNGTGGLLVPPGAPAQTIGVTQSPCNVTGIGTLGGCNTITQLDLDLTHTFVGDIGIFLIGPGGQVLELSTGNGGGGDNYTNTVFTDAAAQFITAGTPPYNGTFRPEGRITNLATPYSNVPALGTFTFANTYNGTNADGTWYLYINDYVAIDVGVINSWSITFNTGGIPPVADAGPDIAICTGSSATLTATGGIDYAWSNGGNTPSITVSPLVTTTYSVTVTQPGCGSDTDEVTVIVNPKPTVMLSTANPSVCSGDCLMINAVFTGTPPFNLIYNAGGIPFSQSFSSTSGSFQVCAPSGAPPGQLSVQATSVSDAFCICN